MKAFKKYISTLLLVSFLAFFGFDAKAENTPAQTAQEKLEQTIEILNHETAVLQMLIKNLISVSSQSYQITAKSYLALDIADNKVLLEKNAGQTQSIASITKLMNAVVAKENIEKDKSITLNKQMLEPEGASPSLYLGLNINLENLLKASLIQSVNDAAQSISYFLGKDKFLDLMNQKAKELQMQNTNFVDVNGLSLKNQSSASDLAKLASYVYKNHPEILKITQSNNFWLPNYEGKSLKFQNINNFYYVSQFMGGKTGYLPEARQNIASVFNVKGKPVAIITLNSANRQADTLAILKMLEKE